MTAVRLLFLLLGFSISSLELTANSRPNILFCISDDQSYAHTGANGAPVVINPLSPPSAPVRRRLQSPPTKFLAVSAGAQLERYFRIRIN